MTSTPAVTVELPTCFRNILLKGVCERINIITYCNVYLKLGFKAEENGIYKGKCPFCCNAGSLLCSKVAGMFLCKSCGKKVDFFDLVTNAWEYDLSFTFKLLALQFHQSEVYGGGK